MTTETDEPTIQTHVMGEMNTKSPIIKLNLHKCHINIETYSYMLTIQTPPKTAPKYYLPTCEQATSFRFIKRDCNI